MNFYHHISDFNMEACFFLEKLKNYRKDVNVVDENLIKYLLEITMAIDEFIMNEKMEVINLPEKTSFDIDISFHDLQLHRSYYCGKCNMNISATKDKIKDHIKSIKHINNDKTKGNQRKNSVPSATPMVNDQYTHYQHPMMPVNMGNFPMGPFNPNLMNMGNNFQGNRNNIPGMTEIRRNPAILQNNMLSGGIMPMPRPPVPIQLLPRCDSVPNLAPNFTGPNIAYSNFSPFQAIPTPSTATTSTPTSTPMQIPVRPQRSKSPGKSKQNESLKNDRQFKRKINKGTIAILNNLDNIIRENVRLGKKIMDSISYTKIINDLEEKLKPSYNDVKAYCFGSRLTGLGTPEGDLDIFIDIGNAYNGTNELVKNSANTIIKDVERLLSQKGSVWTDFEAVLTARTPILKAYNISFDIECDFSFSNGLSDSNTKLIKFFLDFQPVCLKLSVFIKAWAKSALLKNISSYMITLLVIFYLQHQKLLPTVYSLQNKQGEPFLIGPWQADFTYKTRVDLQIPLCEDIRKHILGFFEFYREFDFENLVVCTLLGYAVNKNCFDIGREKLPPEMDSYMKYMKNLNLASANAKEDLFANDSPICVQDPLELVHNVAKGVKPAVLKQFISTCSQSFIHLNTD